MKVLVTGSAGYIGKVVCAGLRMSGYDVVGFDCLDAGVPGVPRFVGDIEEIGCFLCEIEPDVVVHLAAKTSVEESFHLSTEYWRVNVKGTEVLVEEMKRAGCQRLLFASSSSVYGGGNFSEDEFPEPLNVYGETKARGEGLVMGSGLDVVVMRFFNVVGAAFGYGERRCPETSFVPRLLSFVHEGKVFPVNGMNCGTPDGTPVRDYVWVGDVAIAIN